VLAGALTHEVDQLQVLVGRRCQLTIQPSQLTAGFTPHALIDHLQHQEIRLLVLAALAMHQVGAAEVVEIRQH